MSGSASWIWRWMKGRQIAASCGVGVRLPGGRHGSDIGDIDVILAGEPDRRQHPVEQLAGAPDEGQADAVLVGARRLADDHHAAFRVAALSPAFAPARLVGLAVKLPCVFALDA